MPTPNSPKATQATKTDRFVASSFMASLRGKGRQVLLALLLIAAAPAALAGAGTWTIGTDSPVSINAIAMDPYVPSQLVVSSGNGFGRTADSGNSWDFILHGANPTQGSTDTLPTFPSVNLVRLHNQTNVLFSGTPGRGLFRNFTNATQPNWPATCGSDSLPDPLPNSWEQMKFAGIGAISAGLANISALATHPSQPWLAVGVTGAGAYVLTNAGSAPFLSFGACDSNGFYQPKLTSMSTSATMFPAEAWQTTAPAGLPATPTVNALTFDPSQAAGTVIGSAIIYAGMAGQGIYLSMDGGVNWGAPGTQTTGGASFTPATFNIAAIAATTQLISSINTTVIYVGVTGSNAGMYKGVVTPGTSAATSTIAWTQLGGTLPGLSNVRTIAIDPTTPTKIYAGTFGYGIYSIDTSASSPIWSDISTGLNTANANALYVTSLQVDPLNPARLYAGSYGGFFTYEQVSTPKASINVSTTMPLVFSSNSLQQTITLSNTGSAPLAISSITATGSFTLTSGCPASLNPSISCTVLLKYPPETTSSESSVLVITSNAPSSPDQISLIGLPGSSPSQTTANVIAYPTSLSFPGVPVNALSAVRSIRITNTSAQSVALNSILTDNTAFVPDASLCYSQLAANSSCTINVAYSPIDGQDASANLIVTIGGSTTITVGLSGTSADQTTLSGSTYGAPNALTLTGIFFFSSREKASTGNLYIMGYYNGQMYSFDGFSWLPWLTGQPHTYGTTTSYATKSVTILNRVDVSQLKGATFFLGYGTKISDVIRNQTYTLIYTAP